jgi:hypothetical protein
MPSSKSRSLIFGSTVIGLAIGASGVAIGQQWGMSGPGSQLGMPSYMKGAPTAVAELGNNQGVYVEKGNFRIHLGKGDATAEHLDKTGAKKIAHGAMIFRSGDDLYIVDWKKGD